MLRIHPRLAPYKVAVLPLSKKDTLTPTAREVLRLLQPHVMCDYDETQSIGRRYRRQDEIGTPWCVTVDFESLEDHAVTVARAGLDGAGAGADRRARRAHRRSDGLGLTASYRRRSRPMRRVAMTTPTEPATARYAACATSTQPTSPSTSERSIATPWYSGVSRITACTPAG